MRDFWSFLLQTLTASGVAALLLVLKAIFRDKLSPRWQFAVWGVLALFLILPAGWNGRYTLLNWPFVVELLRSAFTGEYGGLARVTVPVPLPPLHAPRTAADWLFVLYGLGALLLLLRYLISYVRLRLALGRGRTVESGQVQRVAEAYGLPACPAAAVDGLPSAFICGVLRPVLALPAGVETDDKVILHELLHLNSRDAAWGLLICLFRCLHWCNPLLWYCADQAGNDLESLCDQRALERLEGEDRRDYGRILLDMADEKYARAPGTSSMANGGQNIRRRIEAIARFKRYPAGMGLVSVCVLLVLAAPLAAGAQAEVDGNPLHRVQTAASRLAYARTVPCTTYAGAFDTYAKAVLVRSLEYRAMCAPLSEQNELAALYQAKGPQGGWDGLGSEWELYQSEGYRIYNLTRLEGEVYEGLLMLKLAEAPAGAEWDGTFHSQWTVVQPLRAEREGRRWVVIPQGEFTAVQGDIRSWGNESMPFLTYEAQWEDFTFQLRRQTASYVNSYVDSGGFFSQSVFYGVPQPGGEFQNEISEEIVAFFHGSSTEWARLSQLSVGCAPMGEEPEWPELNEGMDGFTMSYSGSRSFGGTRPAAGQDWENGVTLAGGGGSGNIDLDLADAYALSVRVTGLDGVKTANLTLLPVEGGTNLA